MQVTSDRPQQKNSASVWTIRVCAKTESLEIAGELWKALAANGGVRTMKADLRAELELLNRNADGIIRLILCAMDAGVWTSQMAKRHTARLELLRVKLNANFRELMVLQERLSEARERARIESPASMPEL